MKLLTASENLKRLSDQTLTGLATLSGFRTLNRKLQNIIDLDLTGFQNLSGLKTHE